MAGEYTFRPAIREAVGLLIGLIGPSGGGKTFSAMRLASGIVGPEGRFAVIDTEARRALHYAEMFKFDHCELHPPFRPSSYSDAILAADKAGYKAIIVDSESHEWAGEGGILDWQEAELNRMAGDDYKKREACKMAAWIKPKMEHKKMVQRFLQIKANLILCFRAEEKTEMINPYKIALSEWDRMGIDEKDRPERPHPSNDLPDKTVIRSKGWQPICDKNMPYELTVSFLVLPEKPGIGQPIKLQEQHKAIFPTGKLLDEEAGKRIAEWAKGGAKKQDGPSSTVPTEESSTTGQPEAPAEPLATGTELRTKVDGLIAESGIDPKEFKAWLCEKKHIGKKFGNPSLSTMQVEFATKMIGAWPGTLKAFNLWVDKKTTA